MLWKIQQWQILEWTKMIINDFYNKKPLHQRRQKSHEETLITSIIARSQLHIRSSFDHHLFTKWNHKLWQIPRETLVCFSSKFWFHLTVSYRWKLQLTQRKPLRSPGRQPSDGSNGVFLEGENSKHSRKQLGLLLHMYVQKATFVFQ